MRSIDTDRIPLPRELSFTELARAHRESAQTAIHTPLLTAGSLSAQLGGGPVLLKAENLQRTGSFKLRGALNKLRSIGAAKGVVAASAGNHAQSLAYAARAAEVPCEVFMPMSSSVGKLAAVRAFGATVHQQGDSVEQCIELAKARASEAGLVFAHPFDDLQVIAGQAGVGIEILEDCPQLGAVVVPIGGGGLGAGVAAAIKQQQPRARIVGVQAELCAPFLESASADVAVGAGSAPTIADGIAVKRPGEITGPLVRELVDELIAVPESAIAGAMAMLLERSKLVVEGAGAASLAAVMTGAIELSPDAATVVVLSGGNVDIGLLANIAEREEIRQGRRLRFFTRVPDRPGGLAQLLSAVAETQANLIHVEHIREHAGLGVLETGVELTLETRGRDHTSAVRDSLRNAGYEPL